MNKKLNMAGRIKFADLAKRAAQNANDDESKQPLQPQPTNDSERISYPNEQKHNLSTAHHNDILRDAYFIPANAPQYTRAPPRPTHSSAKPTPATGIEPTIQAVAQPMRKMSGFTRMNSYNKRKHSDGASSRANEPLLEPENSLDEDFDTNTTKESSLDSASEILHSIQPRETKIKINPFMKRRQGDFNNNTNQTDNVLRQGILRGVQGSVNTNPKGASILRSRLKSRLRSIVEERLTVKQIFQRYVEHSTLHGFLYTCSDTFLIRRVIWACLMILGAIYFFVKLYEGIIEYFEYPFSTLTTVDYVERLDFPAISFCLINSFSAIALQESKFQPLYQNRTFPISNLWKDPGFDVPGEEMINELRKVSLNIDDIFEECEWIKRDTNHPSVAPNKCETSNFTTYFNHAGQLCYTLNSGEEGHPLLHVTHGGMNYGYEALFDLKTDIAFREHSFTGMKVIFHSQNEPPNMDTGFIITPGFKHFIKMSMEETINLPPPYGTECGEVDLKYFQNYNQKACLIERLTDFVGERCGCREPFMADNKLPYCSLKETVQCSHNARELFNEYEERNKCPIDCEQKHFLYEKTDARYIHNPPKGVEPILLQNLNMKKNKNTSHLYELATSLTPDELDHYVEDNLIHLLIFYGEISKQIHEQEATFDFYQFLGDMGGEIGLMLGASLLTFVEFVDLILFLLYHQFLRLYKRKKNEAVLKEDSDDEERPL